MYTIKVHGRHGLNRIFRELHRSIEQSPFRAGLSMDEESREFHLKPIRLRTPKEYCGQHPGECQVNPFWPNRKKPRTTHLEWNDWIQFNHLVNRVLTRLRVSADVWSIPAEKLDKGRKFYARRGMKPRKHYDWEDSYRAPFFVIRVQIWNHGTPDQF